MATPTDGSSGPSRTELVWPGKRTQVDRVALPFQVVETINVSRATREESPLFASGKLIEDPLFAQTRGNPGPPWTNKLIWGDNKYVLASLLEGDPAVGIESLAGKVDLIYIDPPFDTGDDFSYRINIGDTEVTKEPSLIEENAYRDMWGDGRDFGPYLQMLYERLVLARDLMAETGTIYVHLGPNVSHYVKAAMDEVFGAERYINEVIWKRQSAKHGAFGGLGQYGRIHESILFYSKRENWTWNQQYTAYTDEYLNGFYKYEDPVTGRRYRLSDLTAAGSRRGSSGGPVIVNGETVYPAAGRHWALGLEDAEDVQNAMDRLVAQGRIWHEPGKVPSYKRYLDEMPGVVLQDIWTDIAPVAPQGIERLNYDTQKPQALLERVIQSSSNEGDLVIDFFCGSGTTMAAAEKLGRRWIGCDLGRFAIHVSRKRLLDMPDCRPFQLLNLGRYERQHWQGAALGEGVQRYLDFIVELYRGESVREHLHLHGRKAGRMIHVGATDAPVTLSEVKEALEECAANRYRGLDILGWEWEMGLHDIVSVEAARQAVDLRLLTIPREVMDKRAVEAGDIHFYELAYLDVEMRRQDGAFVASLRNFVIPNEELVPQDVREKIKRWSDYVDFWAVDWDFQGDTFHNQWQSYRTRKHTTLRLESDPNTYEKPGKRQVMVKVIDIFGNDTTKLLSVSAG